MIGKTLAHYEITNQLGKGGMGEVYQAKDQKLGRDVAIKFLPEEFARDTDRVARFQREAKLLASLNPPEHCSHLRAGRVRWNKVSRPGTGRRRDTGGSDKARPDPCRKIPEAGPTNRRSPRSRT